MKQILHLVPLSPVLVLASLALAGLAGACGTESPADTEETDVADDTADGIDGPAVHIGTGSCRYEPLTDGQTVSAVAGAQGGYHVWGTFEATGVLPDEVLIDFELFDGETRVGGASYIDRLCQGTYDADVNTCGACLPNASGTVQYAPVAVQFNDTLWPTFETDFAAPRTLRMTLRIEDSAGTVLTDEVELTVGCCGESEIPVFGCVPNEGECEAFGATRPGRVAEHGAAYDEASRSMVVFGGTATIPEECATIIPEYTDETWIYSDPCQSWRKVEADGPSARGRQMMAAGNGKVWLFGGRYRDLSESTYDLFGDLWEFDPSTSAWTEIEFTGPAPSARYNGTLVYDSVSNALWLFGGNSSNSGLVYEPLDDLWRFDLGRKRWNEINAADGPSQRLYHSATFDDATGTMFIYGGFEDPGFSGAPDYFGDLWGFDTANEEWALLQNENAGPDGRFGAQIAFDAAAQQVVMFAGHDDGDLGNRNDWWRFTLSSADWQPIAGGDTFNRPANGVCDFPADFANVDTALPERRSAHSFVWSQACGRGITFGGRTDCGSLDDVWIVENDVWLEVVDAREGEVCFRSRNNPENCANLCF